MSLNEIATTLNIARIVAYTDARQMGFRPRYTSEVPPPDAPVASTGMVAVLKSSRHPVTAPELAMGAPDHYLRELVRVQQVLHRLRVRGIVVSFRCGRRVYWILAERMPMNLDSAQELILRGVSYGDVFPTLSPADQEQLREWYLHEPGLPNIQARNVSPTQTLPGSGNGCPRCGAPLVRDGKCELCVSCGESVGNCS